MNETVFIDTSAWVALCDKKDQNHQHVERLIHKSEGYLYVTTNYIIDETLTLIAKTVGYQAAVNMGENFGGFKAVKIMQVTEELQHKAFALFKQFDDKFFSFTDCTSFAVMKHLAIQKALSFDSDFKGTKSASPLVRSWAFKKNPSS